MDSAVATNIPGPRGADVASGIVDLSIRDSSPTFRAACEPARSPTRHTILLVEDETFVRQSMAAALRSSGYDVVTASDGSQALKNCRNCLRLPDLLISDLVMPGMSGAHLAILFEAMYPWSQILLMSGYAEELAPPRRLRGTAQLHKPFSIGTLIKAVREILRAEVPDLADAGQ